MWRSHQRLPYKIKWDRIKIIPIEGTGLPKAEDNNQYESQNFDRISWLILGQKHPKVAY